MPLRWLLQKQSIFLHLLIDPHAQLLRVYEQKAPTLDRTALHIVEE
jgi:hypothetical protein